MNSLNHSSECGMSINPLLDASINLRDEATAIRYTFDG